VPETPFKMGLYNLGGGGVVKVAKCKLMNRGGKDQKAEEKRRGPLQRENVPARETQIKGKDLVSQRIGKCNQ